MQSKNKASMTKDEREYVRLVKLLPCSLCDEGGGEGAPTTGRLVSAAHRAR
jgi:hypothetical protein